MVSKARLDLPEPDRPVMTTSFSRGMSSETFLRLCSRAPRTECVFVSKAYPPLPAADSSCPYLRVNSAILKTGTAVTHRVSSKPYPAFRLFKPRRERIWLWSLDSRILLSKLCMLPYLALREKPERKGGPGWGRCVNGLPVPGVSVTTAAARTTAAAGTVAAMAAEAMTAKAVATVIAEAVATVIAETVAAVIAEAVATVIAAAMAAVIAEAVATVIAEAVATVIAEAVAAVIAEAVAAVIAVTVIVIDTRGAVIGGLLFDPSHRGRRSTGIGGWSG